MKRLGGILLLLVVAFGVFLAVGPTQVEKLRNRVLPHPPPAITPTARALHRELIIGDMHADSLLWHRDLRERSERGHVDLPRLVEGNVALQAFTIVTKAPAGLNYERNAADARDNITLLVMAQRWPPATWDSLLERALYQAHRLQALAAAAPAQLMLLRERADLDALLAARAAGADTVGGFLGLEGAHALEGNLENLDRLFAAGVRMVGLQHFFDNELGGSLHGVDGGGLTGFGRRVVQRLDELGMIIDVAHSSPQTVRDTLALAEGPLVVSHSGFQGHCPTPRNIDDALMQRIAARGGLVGVGYWDAAICDVSPEGIVAAIRYGIDLLGEDHVALGSDYDGSTTVPFDTAELAVLTQLMLDSGFSDAEIRKVMGGNLLRFLREHLPGGRGAERSVDYAQRDAWALYGQDPAPDGSLAAPVAAAARRADVFYVHPTTFTDRSAWNATLETERTLGAANTTVIARQSASFADCCRIFAPWYRQASSRAFLERDSGGEEAYARAYADVLAAFDHFLRVANRDRPFLLAGHSQGALHVLRLLRERVDGTRHADRLVAAYVIGIPVPRALFAPRFSGLTPCERPESLRCVVAWSSFLPEADLAAYRDYTAAQVASTYGPEADPALLCVNPLTFDLAAPTAGAAEHLGALPAADALLPTPVAGSVSARCAAGVLLVEASAELKLQPIPGTGNMHFHDMGLFFSDLQVNAALRVEAWYGKDSG